VYSKIKKTYSITCSQKIFLFTFVPLGGALGSKILLGIYFISKSLQNRRFAKFFIIIAVLWFLLINFCFIVFWNFITIPNIIFERLQAENIPNEPDADNAAVGSLDRLKIRDPYL